jgi:hypothetical protein
MVRVLLTIRFEPLIVFLIFISSVKLVVETYFDGKDQSIESIIFEVFDITMNVAFLLECMFKILRNGLYLDKNSYLTDGWSWLDFIIVIASILDMALSSLSIPMVKVEHYLQDF